MKRLLSLDWKSVGAVSFLLISGLITIYSFSLGIEQNETNLFHKQLIFLGIGLALFLFFSLYDYRTWRSYSNFLYFTSILLLFAVLFLGSNIRGTSGWFELGFFNLQPVELVKIFVIIFLASYFARVGYMKIGLKEFFISFLIISLPVFLTLKQPDLGSASVLLVIWLSMSFLAGVDKKYLLILILMATLTLFLGWGVFLKDYQKERIQTFLNPERDPLGSGYNVIQSMIAIGSGGITGKGVGNGSQSQLNFLPERHTDFVFASINEGFGMIGSFLTIGFFWILFYRLLHIAKQARDRFGQLLVGGVLAMFSYQVIINIGMNIGIVPVTGISLPFLSYGGSFLIATMISFGICQNVWSKRRRMVIQK
ncbi:MAG: rod shape-determining protein RodA [Candidatus Moranbacteria bacterium]|nr:rod shape-determining protein RodA [Candidatus Moranbacteria bacterium]